MSRIGIDVGGTNTDAVLVADGSTSCTRSRPPPPPMSSAASSPRWTLLLTRTADTPGAIAAVMIGTTHFANAVIEQRDLHRVGALRIGLPGQRQPAAVHRLAGGSRRPGRAARCAWSPAGMNMMAGRIMPLDLGAIRDAAQAHGRCRPDRGWRHQRCSRR